MSYLELEIKLHSIIFAITHSQNQVLFIDQESASKTLALFNHFKNVDIVEKTVWSVHSLEKKQDYG